MRNREVNIRSWWWVVMDEGNRNGGSVYVSKEDGTR